jgi:hypothetical protein
LAKISEFFIQDVRNADQKYDWPFTYFIDIVMYIRALTSIADDKKTGLSSGYIRK